MGAAVGGDLEAGSCGSPVPGAPRTGGVPDGPGAARLPGVEVRDLRGRQFHCDCVDFRINGLGTCKHVEAVLLQLERRFKKLFQAAARQGTNRVDIVPDRVADTLREYDQTLIEVAGQGRGLLYGLYAGLEAMGYRSQDGPEFRLGDDSPRTQEFRLQPSPPITGIVLDPAGQPLADAEVMLATPTESVGCETLHSAAAREKLP